LVQHGLCGGGAPHESYSLGASVKPSMGKPQRSAFINASFLDMKLYSYCLRYDDGAAPNPFWGLCTLVICKPAIRRTANTGDWVVGLGSANSPIGDKSDYVVYAMKITDKMTMRRYNEFCGGHYPNKIPQWRNREDRQLRVGDCIYDYSQGESPKLRWSVHIEENMKRDLGGKYALLSSHFYYFGDKPVSLPERLHPIIQATQGHKSDANQPYVTDFVAWIEDSGFEPNKLYGQPQMWQLDFDDDDDNFRRKCARWHLEADDEVDPILSRPRNGQKK